ncbi:amidohydrolase/deacetylase family metallohydrolase [Brevibacillus ruminantium]|uniref:Amidohydrolase/deacetylase family metallohydrolase n=1 Tax=Brevibacillus ruminantium TaxID=2950604 RepID=A0ABY4WAN3_9BACL|nr:amidohydrolase/deacetylase family metallohydrolase [Brevibacillus ruminantium]USG64220.1 amidohydrolase/deacetylase family metallohydrolase [Brevibacillus ruminantium]
MSADLLIRNRWVIDPSQKLNGGYDLVISDGRIMDIVTTDDGKTNDGKTNEPVQARETIDAAGCIVTPGLIDLHAHVISESTQLGVRADSVGIEQGVTTLVDAGSAGAWTFDAFLKEGVEPSITRVLAFLNISGDGLCRGGAELSDMSRLAAKDAVTLIREQPSIRGIKARMSASVVKNNGLAPLLVAKQAAREAGVPLMVHIGNAPPTLSEVLSLLDEGDVVTHAFHGKQGGILDVRGQLLPEAESALARGVLFDVGHGESSFSFRTMQQAKALGIAPYSISTDVHARNLNGPVHSLTHTMSKFLALGFTMYEIVAACTSAPAKVLGLEREIGTLAPGAYADVTILRRETMPIALTDSEQETILAKEAVFAQQVITSGKVLTCT